MSVLNRLPYSGVFKCSKRLLLRSHQTKPKSKINSYLSDKYVTFVRNFEKTLSEKFPNALKNYRLYSGGLRLFKGDIIIWYESMKKIYSEGYNSLSRRELEVQYQMPKDFMRVAPTIIGALVPFGGFVFIIAYYFPRQLLSHHFWSLQQKSDFYLFFHRRKLKSFKPVFMSIQKKLISLEDDPLYMPMKQILNGLETGVHPSVENILACKPLFENQYSLSNLSSSHIAALLKIHNLHQGWRRRKRLEFKASMISLMDAAIIKEGGFEKLTEEEIKWNCFLRGLNPINMKQEDIYNWINIWLRISKEIDKKSYSLLLHCPVLLGYTQPSNNCLLHNERLSFFQVSY